MIPTAENCQLEEAVQPGNHHSHAFACFHPQWGGYSGKCRVDFSHPQDPTGSGCSGLTCFEVKNWHDGEFPAWEDDPHTFTQYHYCNPLQVVEFGLLVAEKQVGADVTLDGGDRKRLRELRGRIDRLLEE